MSVGENAIGGDEFGAQTWAATEAQHRAAVAQWLAEVPDGAWSAEMSPGAKIASDAVFYRSYANYLKDEGQRETWRGSVTRYGAYLRYRMAKRVDPADMPAFDERLARALRSALRRDVLMSMRALWSAGKVLERSDISAYNCFAMPCDSPAVFWEAPFILMHGTGVGYSVRREHVARLPVPAAPDSAGLQPPRFVIDDSTEGWRNATVFGVGEWFNGGDVAFDYSLIRPKGAPLRTKGGQASGPGPLRAYLNALREVIRRAGAEGRRLTTLEVHDLLCLGASGVQVGGVRRSAMIAVFDADDQDMLGCKNWAWPSEPGISDEERTRRKGILETRGQANNSSWTDRIEEMTLAVFGPLWAQLVSGGCGEPGSASVGRGGYRVACWVDGKLDLLVNPCAEIFLAFLRAVGAWDGSGGGQFCNLTNIILKPGDRREDFLRKAADAAFLGTCQAALTHFPGIRQGTTYLSERDALIGVGLSGQVDCLEIACDEDVLAEGNAVVIAENREWARVIGINEAAGATCVKPDGNTSVLTGAGSGIHTHYAPYYLRRMQISADHPVCKLLRASGVPCIPSSQAEAAALTALRAPVLTESWAPLAAQAEAAVTAWAFEFPIAAPAGAMCAADESPIGTLERVRTVTRGWLREKGHSVSATVYVKEAEWQDVGDWYYAHRAEVGGLTFYPAFEGSESMHGQPLTVLSREDYEARTAALPAVDWSRLAEFENGVSEGAQTFACAGGACSIV